MTSTNTALTSSVRSATGIPSSWGPNNVKSAIKVV